MSNSLPLIITGTPNLRIEESNHRVEYWGPMTYIRVMGVGEDQEDPTGIILKLCGKYSPELLTKIAMAINGRG